MEVVGRYRIAVDIGGTFTDSVVESADGQVWSAKARTTPDDPSRGVLDSVRAVADSMGLTLGRLLAACQTFLHGSTVATNIMITRTGARTALLTTRGHEDAIRIGRGRQRVAGLSESEITHITQHSKPRPIVHPRDVVGVKERVDVDGTVVVSLDEEHARRELTRLAAQGVQSVAISLLWSISNPDHEQRLRDIALEVMPEAFVSISSEVAPVLGEYERTTSTVVNAYVGPAVARYIGRLELLLAEFELTAPIVYTLADGGLADAETVKRRPLATLDSGPAAGVLGVAALSDTLTSRNLLCSDVGGTTFDVGVVSSGVVEHDAYPVVDQYELRLPKVLIKSVGAGGGSIARLDARGVLRVGPQSASASPGPACYGLGGTAPTVTDAYLVLGFLDPSAPLAAGIVPNLEAARAALMALTSDERPSVVDVAASIVRIAESQMADLLHRVTMERGVDPREFALAVYGGAGPLFGPAIADNIGIETVHIMPNPGSFSARGMLKTALSWTAESSFLAKLPLTDDRVGDLRDCSSELAAEVTKTLSRHVSSDRVSLRVSVGMRFALQSHSIDIPLDLSRASLTTELRAAFVARYRQLYGPNSIYEPGTIEISYVRVIGSVSADQENSVMQEAKPRNGNTQVTQTRPVYFAATGWVQTSILREGDFLDGMTVTGPTIVHGPGETLVVPPGWLGSSTNRLVTLRASGRSRAADAVSKRKGATR
ncbi:hydantoinase/oxoprolinase family protein [Subtercola sp. YIM 133946]|uniref:hydantoinase/oxoprolinase family protein n=1 Tax=Subtercola sp. YIM 133946 TaxID=3118909 RepID=UPI002F93A377